MLVSATEVEESEKNLMSTLYDSTFCFSLHPRGWVSWCHLKIVQKSGQSLVIFSELQTNPGTFVTNAAEYLATQVTDLFCLEPASTIYVEHYGPYRRDGGPREETYDLVTFTWEESADPDEPRYLADYPQWRKITPADFARLVHDLPTGAAPV